MNKDNDFSTLETKSSVLLDSNPDAQGIFRLDLTEDRVISIAGISKEIVKLSSAENIDSLIKMIAEYVPQKDLQKAFFEVFCRDSLLKAYKSKKYSFSKDTDAYYDDGSIKASRIFAKIIKNPENNHLECIIQSFDISKQVEKKQELLGESQDQAIRSFMNLLMLQKDCELSINEYLERLGEHFNADRAYIFEYSDDRKYVSNNYEWCAENITSEIENLQNIPASVFNPWNEEFLKKGSFYISCDDDYAKKEPLVYEILEPQNIQSVMAAPFTTGDQIIGFLGLDNPKRHTEQQLFISVAATLLSHEILSRKEAEKEKSYQELLEDRINEITKLNASLTEQVDIIGGLANAYFVSYGINIDTNQVNVIKESEFAHKILIGIRNAEEAFANFIKYGVREEDQYKMKEFCKFKNLPERLKDKKIISIEYHGTTEKEWGRANWIAAKWDPNGRLYGCLFVIQEITGSVLERKRREEELAIAKNQAEAANKAKTSFLFNMSHDIRTPMNAIIGFTNLMEKNYDDKAKLLDYIHKVQKSSSFLLSLVNDVLEMARIESGKISLDETVCKTSEIGKDLYSLFANQMEKKNIKFIKTSEVHTKYIFCDENKIKEIYLNIISNAYKYTPSGGRVSFYIKEIPSKKEGFTKIQSKISDTGIGMSKEFLPHLYDEFSRAKSATESKTEGTGLGMPIVKRLVDLMGGTISVQSELGKGTVFTVTIEHKIAESREAINSENLELKQNNFAGKRILLAEDNDLNAEIAIEILLNAGFEVERADDGIICIDKLQKSPEGYFDLILMDIQMPNMDGYKATRVIRRMKNSYCSKIPIIAMTANAFEEDKKNALNAGMNSHISKPINIPELFKTLNKVL